MDNDRLARTIKNARLKKGYTQSQLADLLNVSNKTISKWETGRGYPDITLLAKITSILNFLASMKMQQLFTESDLTLPFEDYLKAEKVLKNMPPLDCTSLALEKIAIPERKLIRSIVLPGDLGLMISYKKYRKC